MRTPIPGPRWPARKTVTLFFFLSLFGMLSCTRGSEVVGTVGGRKLLSSHVLQRQEIQRLLYRDSSRELAMHELCEAFASVEILARHGRKLDSQDLEREAQRIKQSSAEPALLKKVRDYFGEGSSDYHTVFVLPVLAGRWLRNDFFRFSEETQGTTRQRARDFMAKARHDLRPFSQWGPYEGVTYSEPFLSAKGLVITEASPGAEETEMSLEPLLLRSLRALRPGQVVDQIFELQNDVLILRRGRAEAHPRGWKRMESLSVSKAHWDEWFAKEKQLVKSGGAC